MSDECVRRQACDQLTLIAVKKLVWAPRAALARAQLEGRVPREGLRTGELRSVSSFVSFTNDAAKSNMAGGGIDRLRMARGGTVAATIIRRAEM
jgi:hypothetical protein